MSEMMWGSGWGWGGWLVMMLTMVLFGTDAIEEQRVDPALADRQAGDREEHERHHQGDRPSLTRLDPKQARLHAHGPNPLPSADQQRLRAEAEWEDDGKALYGCASR
jgi:hypothetical protein